LNLSSEKLDFTKFALTFNLNRYTEATLDGAAFKAELLGQRQGGIDDATKVVEAAAADAEEKKGALTAAEEAKAAAEATEPKDDGEEPAPDPVVEAAAAVAAAEEALAAAEEALVAAKVALMVGLYKLNPVDP
jgi:hypothetical protein